MAEEYNLLTPENVELRYEIAGAGSRVAAAIVDYLILLVGYLALFLAVAFADGSLGLGRLISPVAGNVALAIVALIAFLGWWGYFVLCELLSNGQSIGKHRLGLRVVRSGGRPISLTASLIRNVLRLIDATLAIGVLIMLIDRQTRRLGDLAAGTLVVREPRERRAASLANALSPLTLPTVTAFQIDAIPNAERLRMEHYSLIRDYFGRRPTLPRATADALAGRLATDLAPVLGVSVREIGDPLIFLAALLRAFEARHRYHDGS